MYDVKLLIRKETQHPCIALEALHELFAHETSLETNRQYKTW